ncbi:hypothetical protein [Seonamhaeicola maritimus]|uniref:Nuclear transport factor 2 family protein n=1 Tax=Seonamhaeicola maritimus TaxID=2591822 RepID=A0A5C7GHZ3_9FLAO|nr:hypothetical protein [Seonamhaeicola maritimus]TXG37192.1 hypothetical protein FUA22_11560 [Seonamhaeicola maritimus]
MNKLFKTLVILLMISGISYAQTTEASKEGALRDAKTTSEATLKMDFETVLKYTYPPVLGLMGGKEKAIELLTTTFDTMKEQGFVFEKADVVAVSDVVFEQDQYRCYVEGYNQMTMSGMRIKSKSYLLGIYNAENKIWNFIEAKQLKNPALKDMVLPDFITALEIPDDETTTEQL